MMSEAKPGCRTAFHRQEELVSYRYCNRRICSELWDNVGYRGAVVTPERRLEDLQLAA